MSPEAIAELTARLHALRDELTESGPHRADPTRTDINGRRDEDAEPLTEMLQSIASSRNRNQAGMLRQINAALARIEDEPDLVGLCQECEAPIGERRLALMPYAAYCVKCQGALEGPVKPGTRKHLTDFR